MIQLERGSHSSAITGFTPDQMNRAKGENGLQFSRNRLKPEIDLAYIVILKDFDFALFNC